MPVPQFFDMSRKSPATALDEADGPAVGARRERTIQRLQIGITGIVLMILLVGLASVIRNRAAEIDATTVPAAAPTTEPTAAPTQADPLVEAGVVPDLPAQPVPSAAAVPTTGMESPTDVPTPID